MLASQTPVYGLYRAEVANTNDPEQRGRVVLRVPQVLGEALSNWAEPSDPPATIPHVQDGVWVQFSGGDVTKPVYTAYGGGTVDVGEVSQDTMPPKGPTGLNLTTGYVVSSEGLATAWVQGAWVAPTENQDSTPLNDLSRYDARWSYDGVVWTPLGTTTDTVARIENLRPGVRVYVEVQSVDTSNNTSLAASANLITASASDGPPKPSTPTVVGVLGGIRVTWDGLTSTSGSMPSLFDHVVIERSTSSNFSTSTTIGAMTAADSFYDSATGYQTLWYYRLRPVSKQGISGTVSTSGSAVAFTAGTADIDANAVIANIIAVGGLDAQAIKAGSIDASKLATQLVLASVIKTAPFGTSQSHLEMDNSGLRFFDSLGRLATNFPTDPSLSSIFTGDVVANGVTVTGGIAMRSTTNEVSKNGKLILQSGTTASSIPPQVTTGWPSVIMRSSPASGTAFDTACYDGINLRMFSLQTISTKNPNGPGYIITRIVNQYTGPLTGGSTSGSGIDVSDTDASFLHSATYYNGTTYLLFSGASTSYVRAVGTVNATYTLASTISGRGALASDGTYIYVASLVSGKPQILALTPDLTSLVSTYTSSATFTDGSNLGGLSVGSFDLGAQRFLLVPFNATVAGSAHSYSLSGTALTEQTNEIFPLPVVSTVSLVWDGARFWTIGADGSANKHSKNVWTTASASWIAGFTWRQTTNGYETKLSTTVTFTMPKRAWLTLTTPAIPSSNDPATDPDSVSFYIARGASSKYLQTRPAVGVSTMAYDAVTFSGTNLAPTTGTFPVVSPATVESGSSWVSNGPVARVAADGGNRAGTLAVGDVVQPTVSGTVNAGADVQVASRSLPRGYVTSASLAAAYGTTSASTTIVDVTDLTVTFTAVAGRRYRITAKGGIRSTVAADRLQVLIREGATTLDTYTTQQPATTSVPNTFQFSKDVTPTDGTHTYKISFLRSGGTGIVTFDATATAVASISVDDVGLA